MDALLGGASRDRSKSAASSETGSVSPPDTDATDSSGADSSVNETSLEQNSSEPTSSSESVLSESKAQDAAESLDTTIDSTSVIQAEDQLPADPSDKLTLIGIDQIRRGTYQPRRLFDQKLLQELADSIKAEGLIQPILVRPFAGAFELIAGERRWRAAKLIGLDKIPAIVREMSDGTVAAVTLIENIQREDLNPLEEASALYRLKNEFDMTYQAVAEAVGRSRTAVSNLIRLLDLDERVAEMLATGKIEMGHARALLTLPADEQHALAMKVYAEGLSVRVAESLARGGAPARKNSRKSGKKPQDSHIKALESQLSEKLGATVSIDHTSSGKGNITVSYNSLDELDGILSHIN